MDDSRIEQIRALMQYGGRNYSCAVIYLTRIKKKLKITDYTKNNIGDARIIKNYEINHKWFESSKGLVVNLEDKILNFLGLNTRDLIMKDADKSFFDEKITFEEAVTILAPIYFKGDKTHDKEELECATAFKLLMDKKNLTFQDLANESENSTADVCKSIEFHSFARISVSILSASLAISNTSE